MKGKGALQITDSHYEKKTQNEHIIAYFEYFFTCHYSKAACFTCWKSQRDRNYSLWENLFLYEAKIFSFWESIGEHADKENIFFSSLRLPLFSPRYIALKLNQKVIAKISNYLT